VDQCDETGGCSHLPLDCPVGPCQVAQTCDPNVGGCAYAYAEDHSPCVSDGVCDLAGECLVGTCVGDTQKVCNDGDPCTADSCDPDTGCIFEELTPCPGEGFATWNPLDKQQDILLSNGKLTATVTEDSVNNTLRATLPVSEGRWYWEITVEVAGESGYNGICLANLDSWLEVAPGCSEPGLNYKRNGHYCLATEFYVFDPLPTYGAGAVVGVALDADHGKVYLRTEQGWLMGADPENLVGGLDLGFAPGTSIFPCINISQEDVYTANFGQHPFAYEVPSGFAAGPVQ
jgi:hypothetical protein